jgi:hypothetical protein
MSPTTKRKISVPATVIVMASDASRRASDDAADHVDGARS